MTEEFVTPEFIDNSDPDTIQSRMMNNLPVDISDMPADFPYDFTMPTAIEISRLIQYNLTRTLMLMFPMWAWGEWLDLHGVSAKVTRKQASRASGHVTVTGTPGTVIEERDQCKLRLRRRMADAGDQTVTSDAEKKQNTVAYVARFTKDCECYSAAGKTQAKMFPVIKKNAVVDVMKYTETVKGKKWYFIRIPHPTEGFVREFVPAGYFKKI